MAQYTYNGRNWLRMIATVTPGTPDATLIARFDYDGAAPDASLSEHGAMGSHLNC